MKKLLVIICLILGVTGYSKDFSIKGISDKYDLKIKVSPCDENACGGAGDIVLLYKGSDKVFQTITNQEIYFSYDGNNDFENGSPVIFKDVNFDGMEDLIIASGHFGPYGSPTFSVYLFDKKIGRYEFNEAFTDLGSSYLGMFEIDKGKERLTAYSKSGCCWHEKTEFKVVLGQKLQKVLVFTVRSEFTDDGSMMEIKTKKEFINGKWKIEEKKRKVSSEEMEESDIWK